MNSHRQQGPYQMAKLESDSDSNVTGTFPSKLDLVRAITDTKTPPPAYPATVTSGISFCRETPTVLPKIKIMASSYNTET